MLATVLLVIITFIIAINLYIVSVRSGKKPQGERLARIINSDNFQKGIFQNVEETNMERPPFEGIKEMMKKNPDQKPSKPIITLPINVERYKNSPADEVLITWLGHSTVLIRINGITVITDPVFSKRASMFQFLGPKKFNYTNEYALEDLPPVDVVLVSHDHYDHLDFQAIKFFKDKAKKFITPLGVGAHLEHWGINSEKISECNWWEETSFHGIEFTATPGRHFTGRLFSDRFKTLWCGWAIKTEKNNVYFSGDSGYFKGFKDIGEKFGPFDISFVECGQYSKYWPYIHMMPEESVQAALDVKSKLAMPMHWGKFKLSIHTWFEPPTRFVEKATELNLKVASPKIGQTFSLAEVLTEQWWD